MHELEPGIRIIPGQWRPHYPQEHIAWVSPPWPTNDYLWLDFPEAIWRDEKIQFLSHSNPRFEVAYPHEPKVPWSVGRDGLSYERTLPGGISFAGELRLADEQTVSMTISIHNGSDEPLHDVRLQTCAYLRAIREFADYTNGNKLVHTPERGWITLEEALKRPGEPRGSVSVGWGWNRKVADLPLIATVSNQADRLVGMSWYGSTCTLVGNPDHPCMHADPYFDDIAPGETAEVKGELLFFGGRIEEFADYWQARTPPAETRRGPARE